MQRAKASARSRTALPDSTSLQAVFVLTSNPEINVERVKSRVKAGGHDVPTEKIVSRYERSLRNLSQLVRIADHTRVIDNSVSEPHLICEVVNQHLTIWETEQWSKSAVLRLFSVEHE